MRLSADAYQIIRRFREKEVGVFESTNPEALHPKGRFVLLACGDGDRARELIENHVDHHCDGGHDHVCSHLVMENGGALVLPSDSPLASRGNLRHDLVCIANIREACEIKQTKTVVLYVHFPCGMANANQLSVIESLAMLSAAKDRLREAIPDVELIPFVHVDYEGHVGHDRFKTYFFNRKKFVDWLQGNRQQERASA